MDEIPIAARDAADRTANLFLAQYDVPAYIRRAQQVQDAYEQLLARCGRQRDAWLSHVRLCLGRLHALAGEWERLSCCLTPDEVDHLRGLHDALTPRLRVPVAPNSSRRVLRRAILELKAAIEGFNRRWQEYLLTVDLAGVNAQRDAYNRYYLLEKECAVRSARVARQGFTPLAPVTMAELTALLPVLHVPRIKKAASGG